MQHEIQIVACGQRANKCTCCRDEPLAPECRHHAPHFVGAMWLNFSDGAVLIADFCLGRHPYSHAIVNTGPLGAA